MDPGRLKTVAVSPNAPVMEKFTGPPIVPRITDALPPVAELPWKFRSLADAEAVTCDMSATNANALSPKNLFAV